MMNIKAGLYFARKGQDVPSWMWKVEGGNSDVVTDYDFKFSVNCKVIIRPVSLETTIIPVKRHFNYMLHFEANGLNGANISFQPNHNSMFMHGVKFQRLREKECKRMTANRNHDKLSAMSIARKVLGFKNKSKLKNITEAYND